MKDTPNQEVEEEEGILAEEGRRGREECLFRAFARIVCLLSIGSAPEQTAKTTRLNRGERS